MKYITIIFILLSFNMLSAQKSDHERAIRKDFGGLTVNEIGAKLERALSQIKNTKFKSFKDKAEIDSLLDKQTKFKIRTSEINPYKDLSKEDIQKVILNTFGKNVFFQYLNALDVSFISTADDDTRYKFPSDIQCFDRCSYPEFKAKKIFYTDGTTEECNYTIMGEIPTGRLIDKMDIEVNYDFAANKKNIELTAKNTEYNDGDDFVRLISIKDKRAKLLVSKSMLKKSFIIVTLSSGRTLHVLNFSVEIIKYSPKAVEVFNAIKQICENIENGKYTDEEQVILDMIKKIPGDFLEDTTEHALLIEIEDDNIDKISIIQHKGKDSVSVNMTILNADVMSKRLGYRNIGSTIIDNSGNVMLQTTLFELEHKVGPFFMAKENIDDWTSRLYQLDINRKELNEVAYSLYAKGLGVDDNYDYDFILIQDTVNQKYGVTDLKGNIIIPSKYGLSDIEYDPTDQLFSINEGDESAPVEYIINSEGNIILDKNYSLINMGKYFITAYDNKNNELVFDKHGNSLLKENWSTNLYRTGKKTIRNFVPPVIFEEESYPSHNILDEPLLLLSDGTARFFINNKGEIVFREHPQYECHNSFSDGMAIVKNKRTSKTKEKFGYIDTKGDVVIPMIYDKAESFYQGYAKVIKDGKSIYINKENKFFEFRPGTSDKRQYAQPKISIGF